MNQYTVGFYNPKLRKITNIEALEGDASYITRTAIEMIRRYQALGGKREFPSHLWVVFDLFDTLRIFGLDQSNPRQRDCERILELVLDIRNGGGCEREF